METKRIGILGGGQLGRMLALASYPLGVEVKIIDDGPSPCAAQVSRVEQFLYSNTDEILKYFADVDVVTYEFENIPQELLETIALEKPVYPPLNALKTSRNRGYEKEFVSRLGINTPNFILASSFSDLLAKCNKINFPIVVKTCTQGYDGKGQVRFKSREDLLAFEYSSPSNSEFSCSELIAEELINFDYEISCLGVRGLDGKVCFYPICENEHVGGILNITRAPSEKVSDEISKKAVEATKKILETLSYIGVIAVEYFVKGSTLLFNEYAPRVHNSGHWTVEGSQTSQFENHIRACLGLPLGGSQARGYSLMINLLGQTGDRDSILADQNSHYHWYGKSGLGNKRKVGHITAVYDSSSDREKGLLKIAPLIK